MTHVSIIGTGTMGTVIAELVTRGGNTAQSLGRHNANPATGDIVVLAVPHGALAEIVAARKEELDGKVVVDISNPLNFETFDSLTVPADSSSAAALAAALPGSRVLKAFNTNFAATLQSQAVGSQPTTVLIAGDDQDAKQALSAVVGAGG